MSTAHTQTSLRKTIMIFELIAVGGLLVIYTWTRKRGTEPLREREVRDRLTKFPINHAVHLNNVRGYQGSNFVSAGPTSSDPKLRNHLGGHIRYQEPGRNIEAVYGSLINRMAKAEAESAKDIQQAFETDPGSVISIPNDVARVRLPPGLPAEALGGNRYVSRY